jgi:3-hydroxyisobutyrate dehydrogenase-like beta-hydroxyacid dehydrogenase
MRIAFLGLGNMGSAIAGHLLSAGHTVTVWNRTPAKAKRVLDGGAALAKTPAEAASKAELVFTMLMDDASLTHLVYRDGLLTAMAADTIHVCLSTISVALSDRLTADHRAKGQDFVGSPVFGRPDVAEDGKLWTVVAGAAKSVDRVRPLLDCFSRGVTVVSEKPSSAHALKLGGNFLITAMIASLSEGLVFAEANGIDPKLFLETINSALFRSPFYEAYSKIMLDPPKVSGGTIAIGDKDVRLFREAAHGAGAVTPLGDMFAGHLQRAIEAGMKNEDWAAGYYRLAKGLTEKEA